MNKMFFTKLSEKDLEKLKKIKLVAKWFVAIQSILVVLLISTTCVAWAALIANNDLFIFAILDVYFICFGIFTFSVIIKNPDSQSINSAKIKLIIVFVFAIIPATIVFFSMLKSLIR